MLIYTITHIHFTIKKNKKIPSINEIRKLENVKSRNFANKSSFFLWYHEISPYSSSSKLTTRNPMQP